jgi:hypothetical protein
METETRGMGVVKTEHRSRQASRFVSEWVICDMRRTPVRTHGRESALMSRDSPPTTGDYG